MRISDWSSDVCSSDLGAVLPRFIRWDRPENPAFPPPRLSGKPERARPPKFLGGVEASDLEVAEAFPRSRKGRRDYTQGRRNVKHPKQPPRPPLTPWNRSHALLPARPGARPGPCPGYDPAGRPPERPAPDHSGRPYADAG